MRCFYVIAFSLLTFGFFALEAQADHRGLRPLAPHPAKLTVLPYASASTPKLVKRGLEDVGFRLRPYGEQNDDRRSPLMVLVQKGDEKVFDTLEQLRQRSVKGRRIVLVSSSEKSLPGTPDERRQRLRKLLVVPFIWNGDTSPAGVFWDLNGRPPRDIPLRWGHLLSVGESAPLVAFRQAVNRAIEKKDKVVVIDPPEGEKGQELDIVTRRKISSVMLHIVASDRAPGELLRAIDKERGLGEFRLGRQWERGILVANSEERPWIETLMQHSQGFWQPAVAASHPSNEYWPAIVLGDNVYRGQERLASLVEPKGNGVLWIAGADVDKLAPGLKKVVKKFATHIQMPAISEYRQDLPEMLPLLRPGGRRLDVGAANLLRQASLPSDLISLLHLSTSLGDAQEVSEAKMKDALSALR